MRWALPFLVAAVLLACGEPAPAGPGLTQAEALRLALRADDQRRLAFAEARAGSLGDYFSGPALAGAQRRVDSLAQRGQRLEERPRLRCLVHWRADGSPEVVLEVRGERRLAAPRQPDPPWASFVRQWWLRLGLVGGRWLVTADLELPPDRWWPAGESCAAGPGML